MTPIPDPDAHFDLQDPIVLLTMCIWGEARNQPDAARIGVGCVVRNRAGYNGKYGDGFTGVILKHKQFSSFNEGNVNRLKMLTPLNAGVLAETVWASCYQIAHDIYEGVTVDNTEGAVFYYSKPLTEAPQAWGAVYPTVALGDLHFFRDKPLVMAAVAVA